MSNVYLQYGCGLTAPDKWINFDASPTLRLQKTPLLGIIMKRWLNTIFPDNVKYGDIVSGLPIEDNTCKAIYCSHVLEHLALNDFRKALINTYKLLKDGGTFRLVVPDFEYIVLHYTKALEQNDPTANFQFFKESLLGKVSRKKNIKGILETLFGNSNHLWMWDFYALNDELTKVGFQKIRRCEFGDSSDIMFELVESKQRFQNALAIECSK